MSNRRSKNKRMKQLRSENFRKLIFNYIKIGNKANLLRERFRLKMMLNTKKCRLSKKR